MVGSLCQRAGDLLRGREAVDFAALRVEKDGSRKDFGAERSLLATLPEATFVRRYRQSFAS